ncbi:Uncharacterised protein [Mycobacteroides abscessus subsp. bolletii]|uniref:hypothetical protein n=1 Tax=Mycobacteroides abscessus TaxID=36809 RepID=UPI0009270035|nr:hypothetical protein [Mycobacteroides abscessus]SHQ64458.1 Uncharacterised protein [Mycobacteroides abscessus subsp. bolletii]SHS47980.1 Uncharacterised protein [Mycobacteroides abscessus subsp. bolletii]SHT06907.1 Uncharacterised protein [Mycobacteroides abscessus subsp. bolletii]SHT15120.1 Uncharacterised protein [Mycobacteroides abscessus subsp. bolletii]SHY50318.1 Uncharacterised protein [Mycobacteroides abscessus subsp. bolletii]
MVTRKQIDAANPEATVELARHWIWTAGQMETAADDYKGHLDRPGGQYWDGKIAEAVQNRGADDRKAIQHMGDALAKLGADTVSTVTESVMPALKDVRQLIENAEKIDGFTVNDDLSVSYNPPSGTSEERAQQCRDACARFSEQIKDAAEKWWSAEQHAGELIDRATQALSGNFNPLAGGGVPVGGLTQALGWLSRSLTPKESQEAAFQSVFGRAPSTPADWTTAAMLNPHNYDPKYKGVESDIKVAKIEPQPGKGQVQINAFIPGEKVWNFGKDRGDNRGFDKNASPEHSRVSMLVDYENGVVIHRQNPSVNADTGAVAVGTNPDISVKQKGSALNIQYESADGFLPGGLASGQASFHTVKGDIALVPTDSGIQVGGTVTSFPALEIYHGDRALVQYMPSLGRNEFGPLLQLPLSHAEGDASLINQFHVPTAAARGDIPIATPGTQLGPTDHIPTVPVG